jgi:hypothetical protein
VSSPDQLRSYAVDCARLARGATGSEEKARLLNMAQAWAYLAARIERLGRFAKGDTTEPEKAEVQQPAAASKGEDELPR